MREYPLFGQLMMTEHNILDGKKLSNQIKTELRNQIQCLDVTPGLAVVLVGNNASSEVYVGHKQRACEQVGIQSTRHALPASTTEQELLQLITDLNAHADIHGILVQLPLPPHIAQQTIVDAIDPRKDVDGFHAYNLGRLAQRSPALRPCTPFGIIRLLTHYSIPIQGQHVVIVGASNIVGRPMALECLLEGATTTICHRFTHHLEVHVRAADILIVATGKRGIVNSEWVRDETVVVDVGMHRLDNGRLVGDIDFDALQPRVAAITPVPGGVGPMTVAMLLENTLNAANQPRLTG